METIISVRAKALQVCSEEANVGKEPASSISQELSSNLSSHSIAGRKYQTYCYVIGRRRQP